MEGEEWKAASVMEAGVGGLSWRKSKVVTRSDGRNATWDGLENLFNLTLWAGRVLLNERIEELDDDDVDHFAGDNWDQRILPEADRGMGLGKYSVLDGKGKFVEKKD